MLYHVTLSQWRIVNKLPAWFCYVHIDKLSTNLHFKKAGGKMKAIITSNIPHFLLPRGIPSHTLRLYARRNLSSSSTRRAAAAEDKPRVLGQPDKFRPPSHPARRVVQTRNGKVVSQNVREPFNYPGRPLSAKEREEQKMKRYPNMFPAEGTVLFKFLTSRWIHVWIAMVCIFIRTINMTLLG